MSQYNESGLKTFTAGLAISDHLRVIITTGKLALAGATDHDLGTLRDASFADGDIRSVNLRSKQGTAKCIAAGAITMGALVYTAASGKVNDIQAVGSFLRGMAMETVTADGDVIEVMPLIGDTAGV